MVENTPYLCLWCIWQVQCTANYPWSPR